MSYTPSPISFISGINPEPDETKQNTRHIIDGNNIRFRRGGVEKIGGHLKEVTDWDISGTPRTLLSFEDADGLKWQLIGTNSKLYAKQGGTLTNITPLKTATIALGNNPGRSRYDDIQNTPLTFTNGSDLVRVSTFTYTSVVAGDTVTISGIAGSGGSLNGIPITELNATHLIAEVNVAGQYLVIRTTTDATSSGSPTEAASVITVKKFRLEEIAHGRATGDRVKVSGFSGTVGGIPAAEINGEHIIQVVTADTWVLPITSTATSDATGGGAAVLIQEELDAGEADAVAATGPGIGTPGLGLPGSIQTDDTLFVQPRIWWADMFGDIPLLGPGQGAKGYQWLGSTAVAPTIITNSPDFDWGWVEDGKLCGLEGNTVFNSDTGDYTDYTAGVSSSAYSDDKEDASKLIGRAFVNGENLIFADENKIFSLRWVGGTTKWAWRKLTDTIGIMGPQAYIVIGSVGYIFAKDNLYAYNGGFTPLPNNTLYKYVYDNLNNTQRYKCFAWFLGKFSELNFHYPSNAGLENDKSAIFSLTEAHWTKRDDLARTAADAGGQVFDYPVLASPEDGLYQHEVGYDDDSAAMYAWYRIANEAIRGGKVNTAISGMEPDLILTGDLTVDLYGKDRMRDDEAILESFTLTESGDKIDCDHETRWRSWRFGSNAVGGYFRSGGYREFIAPGSEF